MLEIVSDERWQIFRTMEGSGAIFVSSPRWCIFDIENSVRTQRKQEIIIASQSVKGGKTRTMALGIEEFQRQEITVPRNARVSHRNPLFLKARSRVRVHLIRLLASRQRRHQDVVEEQTSLNQNFQCIRSCPSVDSVQTVWIVFIIRCCE